MRPRSATTFRGGFHPASRDRGFHALAAALARQGNLRHQTNRYRRLTRNLEQSATAAENAVEVASFHRVLKEVVGQNRTGR
jgi:hypothetical protein